MKITRRQLKKLINETLQEEAAKDSPLKKLGKAIRSAGWHIGIRGDGGLRIQHGELSKPETYYDGILKWEDEPK